MDSFVQQYYILFLTIHFIGFAIGLGASTVSDYLFLRFSRDAKIDAFESDTLKAISTMVWVGVALFVISGVFLFLGKPEALLNSSSFLAKVFIALIVITNGVFLHSKVAPNLRKLKFKKESEKAGSLRLQALIGGVVSITSWYSVLLLALSKGFGLGLSQLLMSYFSVLLGGIIIAFILNRNLHKFF